MKSLKEFVLDDIIIAQIRETRIIPVNFYNRQGQVIIPKKQNASAIEIKKLLQFARAGIYYNPSDSISVSGLKAIPAPIGFSNKKLISAEKTFHLSTVYQNFIHKLLESKVTAADSHELIRVVKEYFLWFENQTDVLKGLLNVNEICLEMNAKYTVTMAIKRAVVIMALKSRIILRKNNRNREEAEQKAIQLMVAALLTHVGLERLNHMREKTIKGDDINYVRQYPLVSYLLLAPVPGIPERVKTLLLVHKMSSPATPNNNSPDRKWLIEKLRTIALRHADSGNRTLAKEFVKQIKILQQGTGYHASASLLSIASEMASLSTKTPWRPALFPEEAVQIILNESLFTYNTGIVQEFLDYVALSLSQNIKFLVKNKVVILEVNETGQKKHYEVALILTEGMYQARPEIMRLGRIVIRAKKTEKQKIVPFFVPASFEADPRLVVFDLSKDRTRRIVYAPDYELHGELLELAHQALEATPPSVRPRLTEIPALI